MILVMDGQPYVVEPVRIEDLPEWRKRLGLEPVGRVTLDDGNDWPPMVLYGRPGGTTDATA